MKEKDIQYLSEHLESVIQKTVNGKIDRLHKKLDAHIDKLEPVFEVYDTAKRGGGFIIWISKVILAVGVIVGAVIYFK